MSQNLLEKINSDMKAAFKKKDRERVSVLRLVLSAAKNAEIAKRPKKLTDDDVKAVLSKEIKDREESIRIYQAADKADRVEQAQNELKILREYIPELEESEVVKIIEEGISKLSVEGSKDMGKLMGFVMPKVKGQMNADKVKKLVQNKLVPQKESSEDVD